MNQSHVPKWRKHISAGIFGVAAIAMAVGAFTAPAVSHAAFDKKSFDSCALAADKRFVQTGNAQTYQDDYRFCCDRAGGVWNLTTHECTEAGTFQPAPTPLPSQVATGPGQASLPGTRAG